MTRRKTMAEESGRPVDRRRWLWAEWFVRETYGGEHVGPLGESWDVDTGRERVDVKCVAPGATFVNAGRYRPAFTTVIVEVPLRRRTYEEARPDIRIVSRIEPVAYVFGEPFDGAIPCWWAALESLRSLTLGSVEIDAVAEQRRRWRELKQRQVDRDHSVRGLGLWPEGDEPSGELRHDLGRRRSVGRGSRRRCDLCRVVKDERYDFPPKPNHRVCLECLS